MKPGTAKQKGAATETAYVEFLKANGVPNAERRHLAGSFDKGDIAGWCSPTGEWNIVVEVKSGASLDIQGWLRELDAEIINASAVSGHLAVRPKGKPNPNDWFIVMRTGPFMELMERAGYL